MVHQTPLLSLTSVVAASAPQSFLGDQVCNPRASLQTIQSAQRLGWGWEVASRVIGVRKPGRS